jgi:glycine cleavage system aminomethyltransferase T
VTFDGWPEDAAELRGMPVMAGGGIVGRVTSAATSPEVGSPIGLAWIRTVDDRIPVDDLRAGDARVTVAPMPFYDPNGGRLRG